MRDPDDHTAHQPAETLQVGPSRPPFFQRFPARWRRPAGALLVFVLGVAGGVTAAQWWQEEEPAPLPSQVDEHAVELVLFEAVPFRTRPGGSEPGPLRIDGALLLSGVVSSTVLSIEGPGRGLAVRVPALPVTVSPSARYQAVALELVVRDCDAAVRWTPEDRPFTIGWRDEYGKDHVDGAGDFGRPMAEALTSYIDVACGSSLRR